MDGVERWGSMEAWMSCINTKVGANDAWVRVLGGGWWVGKGSGIQWREGELKRRGSLFLVQNPCMAQVIDNCPLNLH